MTSFEIEPLDGAFRLAVNNALVGDILTTENDHVPTQADVENYKYLEGIVEFTELDDGSVDLMLGAKWAFTWERGERVYDGPNKPIAIHTDFGWG